MRAADRLAAMDFDSTDGLSVDEMGIDYGWPEPGDQVGTEEGTAQLYWPATRLCLRCVMLAHDRGMNYRAMHALNHPGPG